MQVTIPRKELAEAVGIAARAISPQSTLPVLKNVLIEAITGTDAEPDGRVQISATDLERHIVATIPGRVERPGTCCVSGKGLVDLAGALPEADVALTAGIDGEQMLTIQVRRSKYTLQGLAPEDMPAAPPDPSGNWARFGLPQRVLKRAFAQVVFATADDDTRPVMQCLLFRLVPSSGRLTLVATDTHRLAEACVTGIECSEVDPELTQIDTLVPGGAVREVLRLMKDTDDPIWVTLEPNGARFATAAAQLHTRVVEGAYPRYERVIPATSSRQVRASRTDLLDVIRRVRLVARDAAAKDRVVITLQRSLTDAPLVVTAQAEGNEAREELDVEFTGEELTLAVNAGYALDALAALDAVDVLLELNEPLSPVLIRPASAPPEGRSACLSLLMPMQVQ